MDIIRCEKCGEDISAIVDRKMMEFSTGRISCPKCQKQQSRYISESDLLLYLIFSEIIYLVICAVTLGIYYLCNRSIFSLAVLVPLFLLNIYLQRIFVRKIYLNGYGKKNFMNYEFKEDPKAVKRGISYRIIIFFSVSMYLLTTAELNQYIFIFIILTLGETYTRYRKVLKKEKLISK